MNHQAVASTASLFAPPALDIERRDDGAIILRSSHRLDEALPLVADRLAHWATTAPDRPAFVECRDGAAHRTLSYRETERMALRLAAGLARLPVGRERPVATIAGSGIDHAVLRLAAMIAGAPFAPLSAKLPQLAGGRDRLAALLRLLTPGLVYADDPRIFDGLAAAVPGDTAWIAGADGLTALAENPPRIAPTVALDDIAAIFFTSGSTGAPKGVITTQRMLSANQAAAALLWPFLAAVPPALLDWLPWHHTFGGNDNFNKMLWHGGTLYIDDGGPTPDGIARTCANMALAEPTLHLNVPRGLELLLPRLEDDARLRAAFFAKLRAIFFAGAGLALPTWERLRVLLARHEAEGGRTVALVSGWGATETGSTVALVHFPIDRPTNVGLPLPGYALKLVPRGGKLEACVKGPNVTPGYWRNDALTRAAFDDEGYFRTGDAVAFLDPAEPSRGLVFDGRLAEDFKLSTGTWVSTGPLRAALVAALSPLARDVAAAGRDRDRIGILIFLDVPACRAALDLATGEDEAVAAHPSVVARIVESLARHNRAASGSSTVVRRALLLAVAPSAEAGEINDKGHLNQRAALQRRPEEVAALFAEPPPPRVITL